MEEDFIKQFSGSASANVVTFVLVGVFMMIKKCMDRPSNYSHSKCTSCCLSVELDKDDSSDDEDDIERGFQEKVEKRMRELLGEHRDNLLAQYIPTVSDARARGGQTASDLIMAISKKAIEETRFPEVVSPKGIIPSRNKGEPGVRERTGQI